MKSDMWLSIVARIVCGGVIACAPLFSFGGCGGEDDARTETASSESVRQGASASTARIHPADDAELGIVVKEPRAGAVVTERGLTVSGTAGPKTEYVRYALVLDDVMTIASGRITVAHESRARPDFHATIEVDSDWSGDGTLELCRTDSTGDACQDVRRVPLRISVTEDRDSRNILVYFANSRIGSASECEVVYPVTRPIPRSCVRVARAALYQLLLGPNAEEQSDDYRTEAPAGIRLQSLSLDDGIARIDFNRALTHISEQCERDRFRAQVEQTLVQFESVRAIALTVDGDPWDAR